MSVRAWAASVPSTTSGPRRGDQFAEQCRCSGVLAGLDVPQVDGDDLAGEVAGQVQGGGTAGAVSRGAAGAESKLHVISPDWK
ncbi:hypothetical protein GS831_05735 [Rhodococcus hoagii]|nr:hypothetical protein [Prescottella equi]